MKKTRNRSCKLEKIKTEVMLFRLSSDLKKEYLKFCENHGFSYGKRLRLLIQNDLKNV